MERDVQRSTQSTEMIDDGDGDNDVVAKGSSLVEDIHTGPKSGRTAEREREVKGSRAGRGSPGSG